VEMDCLAIIARIGWCSANAFYVLSVSAAAAFLDSVNRRFVVSSWSSSHSLTSKDPCDGREDLSVRLQHS
jgi:hypothetical protein